VDNVDEDLSILRQIGAIAREMHIHASATQLTAQVSECEQVICAEQNVNRIRPVCDRLDHIELIQKRIRDQANGLDGVIPPEDAEAAHDELIDALRDYAGELDSFKEGDGPVFELAKTGERIIAAGQKFQKQGYGPWLTDEAVSALPCPRQATYSWPRGPWCTE